MPLDVSETFFSTQTLLWLAGSAVAALLLFGSINRRRSRLTDTLRGYVNQNQERADSPTPGKQDESAGD
jgi:hypothetical protein